MQTKSRLERYQGLYNQNQSSANNTSFSNGNSANQQPLRTRSSSNTFQDNAARYNEMIKEHEDFLNQMDEKYPQVRNINSPFDTPKSSFQQSQYRSNSYQNNYNPINQPQTSFNQPQNNINPFTQSQQNPYNQYQQNRFVSQVNNNPYTNPYNQQQNVFVQNNPYNQNNQNLYNQPNMNNQFSDNMLNQNYFVQSNVPSPYAQNNVAPVPTSLEQNNVSSTPNSFNQNNNFEQPSNNIQPQSPQYNIDQNSLDAKFDNFDTKKTANEVEKNNVDLSFDVENINDKVSTSQTVDDLYGFDDEVDDDAIDENFAESVKRAAGNIEQNEKINIYKEENLENYLEEVIQGANKTDKVLFASSFDDDKVENSKENYDELNEKIKENPIFASTKIEEKKIAEKPQESFKERIDVINTEINDVPSFETAKVEEKKVIEKEVEKPQEIIIENVSVEPIVVENVKGFDVEESPIITQVRSVESKEVLPKVEIKEVKENYDDDFVETMKIDVQSIKEEKNDSNDFTNEFVNISPIMVEQVYKEDFVQPKPIVKIDVEPIETRKINVEIPKEKEIISPIMVEQASKEDFVQQKAIVNDVKPINEFVSPLGPSMVNVDNHLHNISETIKGNTLSNNKLEEQHNKAISKANEQVFNNAKVKEKNKNYDNIEGDFDDIERILDEVKAYSKPIEKKKETVVFEQSDIAKQPTLSEIIKTKETNVADESGKIIELTKQFEEEKAIREELLEKTRQLNLQINEYENEMGDLNANMNKTGKILSVLITILVITLFVIIFVICYWFFQERGLI